MVVGYLNDHGWPYAERRRLTGSADRGDIAGIPDVVIEVKGDRSNRLREWKRETLTEIANASAGFGLLVVRTERKPIGEWDVWVPWHYLGTGLLEFGLDVEDWQWVRMDLRLAVTWLKAMGY